MAYLAGPGLVFEFANQEYRRYVGGRDLIGLGLGAALLELPRERLETVARVGRSGQPFQDRASEVWIRRRGDEPEQMFVDRVFQPVPDGAGGVAGVLVCANDVTSQVRDRRRLEELAGRLAATEERHGTLFETLPHGVIHYSADGTIIGANPAARNEQGRPQRAYAMFTDITEQHRAEAALRQSNRLLGRLRNANVLGVVVSSEEGVHEVNDAFLDIIGYTRDDIESWPMSWRAITPSEWAAADHAAVEQLRRTGAFRPYEKEYLHRDGHRVPCLIGAAVLDWHPLRWTTFVVDLSARQRREQERAALVAREQAARNEADTARERLEFLLQAGDVVAATADRADLLSQVCDLVEVAVTGEENRSTGGRDESAARRAQAALSALNAELEERVSRRTSELLRAEADRRALEAELLQGERLQTVGQLTSGIAHDFGNLLAVIVGYAEMAQDVSTDRDPELHRILEEIHSAADRAVQLSSDLLRFSGRTRAMPEEIDLNTLIMGIKDLLSASMNGRAEVLFEPSPTALPAVLADRGRLEQVLLNLAVNARDAMPEGGTLTISTRPAAFDAHRASLHPGTSPGSYVELAVQDTGIGMRADVRARIFERFFTAKPPGTGTGLGLSTVHGIIADLGGAIDVDSREGRGTTFRIYLPAIPDPAETGA